MVVIAFFNTGFGAPAIIFNFPEEFIVNHHSGAAWLVMFKTNKPAITKFIGPVGKLFGKNMGVDVDGKHFLR